MCFSSSTSAEHVVDYLAVGQKTDGGADERVVLFVKLSAGQELSPSFETKIKNEIRSRRSARHVPARVRALVCGVGYLVQSSYSNLSIDNSGGRYTLYP